MEDGGGGSPYERLLAPIWISLIRHKVDTLGRVHNEWSGRVELG